MAESFDAYHKWLGIAPEDQPPHHYRLLGIEPCEAKTDVIQNAADRQMAHLRTFQAGPWAEQSQRLLNEVSAARLVLLDQDKKAAYDDQLKQKLNAQHAAAQPRVARAVPLDQPASPQIHVGSSPRRSRRKQHAPWLALGVGAAVLGVVAVIAIMGMTGDDTTMSEMAEVNTPDRPSQNAADSGNKPGANTTPPSADVDTADPDRADPPEDESPDTTPGDDPSSDDVSSDVPKDDPSDDKENPFEIVVGNDPSPDDPAPDEFAPLSKAAIPDQAALAKAEGEIRDVFDVDATIDVEAKAKLAREILEAARESDDDPVSQFVMLQLVLDLSAKHGDYVAAERSIKEMDKRFEVDAVALRSQAMIEALASKTPPDWRKKLCRGALGVVADFHTADRFEQADKLMSVVLRSASRMRDQKLLADVRKLRSAGVALAKQYEAVRPALETLKTKPDDPAANSSVGKYLCFVKGDWDRGLAMLVQGDDKSLRDLALREQRSADNFAEQLAVADAWWNIAEKLPSHSRDKVRGHAAVLYQKALPRLDGYDKLRVQKRLDSLNEFEKNERTSEAVSVAVVKNVVVIRSLDEFETKHGERFPSRKNLARGGTATASSQWQERSPGRALLGSRSSNSWTLDGKRGQFQVAWRNRPAGQYILLFGRASNSDPWGKASISINGQQPVSLRDMQGGRVAIIELTSKTLISSILINIDGVVINGAINPGLSGLEIHP